MTKIRYQTEAMIVLDDIVDKKHPYRAYDRMVDFRILAKPMHARRSDRGRREIGAERGLRMPSSSSSRIVPTARWNGS